MKGLSGKAVIITGAGRGIGAACARAAAELGAAVVVNDIDESMAKNVADEIVARGGQAVASGADIAQWAQAASLMQQCVDAYGKLDGLVNNAAIYDIAPVEDTEEETWRRIIEVNVLGTSFCLVHAVRQMKLQGYGSIVNVSSSAHHGMVDRAPYGTSKGAVASLTYCAAVELASTRIRVNAVSPRAATRMAERSVAYAIAAGRTPRTGWGNQPPEQNAPAICYLLSDESAQLNGQMIRIDGDGLTLVGHPVVIAPYVRRESWSFEDVCEAFTNDLDKRLQPLGVVAGAISFEPGTLA